MAGALSGGRRGLPRVCPRVVAEVWVASFRANLVVTVALFVLMVTFALGAGTYRARTGVAQLSGDLGLVTAALAGYWPAPGRPRPRAA
jgi:hypothetical protein